MRVFLFLLLAILLLSGCTVDNPANLAPQSVIIAQGRNENGAAVNLKIDATTGAISTVGYEESELHQGRMFTAYYVVDVPNAGNLTLKLLTPAASVGYLHYIADVQTESEATYELYEEGTTSADGTPVDMANRNRNSSSTAQAQVWYGPTITNLGTRLSWIHWGSGRGVGGGERGTEEWLLKPETIYIIRVTNETANPNQVSVKISEHRQ